jgi:hypothetical protein
MVPDSPRTEVNLSDGELAGCGLLQAGAQDGKSKHKTSPGKRGRWQLLAGYRHK